MKNEKGIDPVTNRFQVKYYFSINFYTLFHSQRGQKHSLLSGTSPYSTMKVNLQI